MSGPGSVVVGISNTGRSTSVLDIAAQGKKKGATLIGIAGAPRPLIELADVLATAVAVQRGAGHLTQPGEMKEALTSFRGRAEQGLRSAPSPFGDRDGGGRE